MIDILSRILASKREEVTLAKQKTSLSALHDIIAHLPEPRNFAEALHQSVSKNGYAVIAEIKKASPSKGVIREPFDPATIAKDYQAHGATCLSVLTDNPFFQGSLEHLHIIRDVVDVPLLRKDFIIDHYQIAEACAAGADAILLIAACLDDHSLNDLLEHANDYHLTILIEVHNAEELKRVQALSLHDRVLIGVNNRDLKTFEVSLETIMNLKPKIPTRQMGICESGIQKAADVALMLSHGINTFLIGEALMREANPGEALHRLFIDQ